MSLSFDRVTSFTPATADPKLAAEFANKSSIADFKFTPAAPKGRPSQIRVAIRARGVDAVRGRSADLGVVGDVLVRKLGLKQGRRIVGMAGVGLGGVFMLLSLLIEDPYVAAAVLALGFAASDFMLPTCWAVCLDIGKESAGTVTGAMNMAGQMGATIMSYGFGVMVEKYGWAPAEIPANTFKGQTTPVKTVKAVSNILVNADVPDAVAYTFTKTIIENAAKLPKIHAALSDFDPKRAAEPGLNGNCPLHPGAAKYYKEAGMLK